MLEKAPCATSCELVFPLWPQVLQIQEGDVCLTLTSGGCNALNLCIQGAAQVVSVDCNPAQSALLELKAVAIQCALCPLLYRCLL